MRAYFITLKHIIKPFFFPQKGYHLDVYGQFTGEITVHTSSKLAYLCQRGWNGSRLKYIVMHRLLYASIDVNGVLEAAHELIHNMSYN